MILLIACGLCAGMFFYTRETPLPKTETLTLWYAESDCAPAVMESLINRCRKETGIQIKATSFADETALAAAFEGTAGVPPVPPDLLFCSHVRAARLRENGGLAEITQSLQSSATLSEAFPFVGRSFFPIGSRLPVLLVNTSLTEGSFDNLDALLSAAGESPFLGCDAWEEFLYAETAARGIQLTGDQERDLTDGGVAELYNALALAVFRGGLVLAENPSDYVRQGKLACAVTMSTTLAGLSGRSLDVRLLPLPEGAEAQYPAELMGFALLRDGYADAAETFAFWLWNGQGPAAAVDAGMAPIMRTDGKVSGSTLGKRLDALTAKTTLYLLNPDESFIQNREACGQWIRERLDLLT